MRPHCEYDKEKLSLLTPREKLLINTGIPPGVSATSMVGTRFNGFAPTQKTAEAVLGVANRFYARLKPGVNESSARINREIR
jgi:hypothetical protein